MKEIDERPPQCTFTTKIYAMLGIQKSTIILVLLPVPLPPLVSL